MIAEKSSSSQIGAGMVGTLLIKKKVSQSTPGLYECWENGKHIRGLFVFVPANKLALIGIDESGRAFEPCDAFYANKTFVRVRAHVKPIGPGLYLVHCL